MTKKQLSMSSHVASRILDERLAVVVKALNKMKIKSEIFKDEINLDRKLGIDLELNTKRNCLFIYPVGFAYSNDLLDLAEDNSFVTPEDIPEFRLSAYDKKHRQVVLNLREQKRTITRTVSFYSSNEHIYNSNHNYTTRFGLTVPESTTWSVKNRKVVRDKYRFKHTAEVTANIPATDTSFLIGYDEKHMFISMLKNAVNSVKEAHQELLPKELGNRKDYKRQGEFFFVPATKKMIENISSIDTDYCLHHSDGEDTDHFAQMHARIPQEPFHLVCGSITNSRHEAKFFDRWMVAYVNDEVPHRGKSWD